MRVIGFAFSGAHNDAFKTGLVTMRRGLPMALAIILSEKVKTACDVAGASRSESGEAPFTQKAMNHLPTQGRSATVWIRGRGGLDNRTPTRRQGMESASNNVGLDNAQFLGSNVPGVARLLCT